MSIPTTLEMRRLVAQAVIEYDRWHDAERRRLLGMWVSELEPEMIYEKSPLTGLPTLPLHPLGIGYAGNVVILAVPYRLRHFTTTPNAGS